LIEEEQAGQDHNIDQTFSSFEMLIEHPHLPEA
jgi:hypothetical protein